MVMLMMMTILLLLLSRRTKDEIESMWVDTLFDENIKFVHPILFIFYFYRDDRGGDQTHKLVNETIC